MPQRVPPIARVRLARSLPRLLAWPLMLIGAGVLAAAVGLLGPVAGPAGIVAAGIGALVVLLGLGLAAVLLTVRLEVAESAVRVSWLGGERIYPLVPGPVTRVRFRGPNSSRLRSRPGLLGWGLGTARLRDEEQIRIVRLAPTATAILVPTERGRLAIAPVDEDALLDALSRAARARQRLEELTSADEPVTREPDPVAAPAPPEAAEVVFDPTIEVEPHLLTGIERALLEQRLADSGAAAPVAPPPAEPHAPAPPEPGATDPVEAPSAAAAIVPEAAPSRRIRSRFGRPGPSAAIVLLPLLAAGAVWGAGILLGRLPPAGTDLGRLTSLALVLAGPATSVGAIVARVWWPRTVGVVVVGGLAASLFVARALLPVN